VTSQAPTGDFKGKHANMSSMNTGQQGSLHTLSHARTMAAAPTDITPKQQMLDTLDVLRARVDAGFVTGFQVYAGTRLGEPVEDTAAGTFAHSPLDSALLVAHSLYRRLYSLKEAELDRLAAPLRQHGA
jgi:hypothetical protein